MSITLNEKYLSPEAQKALENSKNKSQFMRDALEFYVNRKNVVPSAQGNDDQMDRLLAEMDEMKSLIKDLASRSEGLDTEKQFSKRSSESKQEKSIPSPPIESKLSVRNEPIDDEAEKQRKKAQEEIENSIASFGI
jgi:hypothetical protein